MEIQRFVSPLLEENMYVVSEDGHAIIVDPHVSQAADAMLQGVRVDFMLATHEHYDHISGVNEYKRRYRAPLYANAVCNRNMQNPAKNFAKYEEAYLSIQSGVSVEGIVVDSRYACEADRVLEDGEVLDWMGHRIRVKMAPGHSEGSNLLFFDEATMFSGDTMLPKEVPAARFPGGNPKRFSQETVPYLRSLPGDMMVYPGHGERLFLREYYLWAE